MKKYLKSICVASLVAMFAAISFTGCSNNVSAFDSCEVENAARSAYANRVTLYSDLTPAYGEAVECYYPGLEKIGTAENLVVNITIIE